MAHSPHLRRSLPRSAAALLVGALACGSLALSPRVARAGERDYAPVAIQRLVNERSGAHLITADANEAATLDGQGGWKVEGVAFYAPAIPTGHEVLRLLNPSNGDHLYTTDANEYQALQTIGWKGEGVAFYGAESDLHPVRRLWNSQQTAKGGLGSHLWTATDGEYDALPDQEPGGAWRQEGTAWNAEALEAPTFTFEGQSLGLASLTNDRQLGGLVMADGRTVRDGLLLRSAALDKLSAEDEATLAGTYHLRHICDFRTESETAGSPDVVPEGATHHTLPALDARAVYDLDTLKALAPVQNDGTATLLTLARHEGMSQIYRKILPTETARQAYRGFFDALLENARSETPGAVLWHCTQGKDRAGLASALLLTALGVDDATVRRDYSFSAEAYRDATAALLPLAQSEGLSDHETRELFGLAGNTDPEYLQMAIESIRSEYGSLRGYLERAIGLTEADFTALRDAYLTDAR